MGVWEREIPKCRKALADLEADAKHLRGALHKLRRRRDQLRGNRC
jgi:hypothetical protein